jgi:hypothetical protein
MNRPDPAEKFAGIQISPISFVDEGVDAVLDTLQNRVGVNVLMLGTVSWLGLKSGRSISHALDGWPDHGVPEPYQMRGGAYFDPDPRYYRDTFMADYRSRDPEFAGKDILKMVIPAAHARGMKVYVELMEPFFKYAGHGSAAAVEIPTLPQAMEVDALGRLSGEPSTSNPGYRTWIHSMIEDQVRNHDIDGLMWCNERNSPLDTLIQGGCPGDFSAPARVEAQARGIDVEACRRACLAMYDFCQEAAAGKTSPTGPSSPSSGRFSRTPNSSSGRSSGSNATRTSTASSTAWSNGASRSCPSAERLEPQPFQHLPSRAMALGGADELRRLREAHHLPASGGRGLGEGTRLLPEDDPARLRTGRGDHCPLPHPRAGRGAVGEPRGRGHGPRHLRRGPMRRCPARRRGQGQGLHGDRRRCPPLPPRHREDDEGHRLPLGHGDLPGGRARDRARAELRLDAPHPSRRRGRGALGTGLK